MGEKCKVKRGQTENRGQEILDEDYVIYQEGRRGGGNRGKKTT